MFLEKLCGDLEINFRKNLSHYLSLSIKKERNLTPPPKIKDFREGW